MAKLTSKFVDLHVHLGMAGEKPIKITASRRLTPQQVISVAGESKGLDVVGIVDALAKPARDRLEHMLRRGDLSPLEGGGLRAKNGLVILPGYEFEVAIKEGLAHFVAFFPGLKSGRGFAEFLSHHVTNMSLSSQRCYAQLGEVADEVGERGGLLIPAHAFTPFKSVYGRCTDSLRAAVPSVFRRLAALELGLSADTRLACVYGELRALSFLSNSDAHSPEKIAREYNEVLLGEPSFAELRWALEEKRGRKILANYGLDPRLGKYHRSFCRACQTKAEGPLPVVEGCEECGGGKELVVGVWDRIADHAAPPEGPLQRPEYRYQIPLLDIPGIGEALYGRLLKAFGNEIEVIWKAGEEELTRVVGRQLARRIINVRQNRVQIEPGGGGQYGKVRT